MQPLRAAEIIQRLVKQESAIDRLTINIAETYTYTSIGCLLLDILRRDK
jgi:hypothetical protein